MRPSSHPLTRIFNLVLCRFGRAGLAYIETDPAEADATTVGLTISLEKKQCHGFWTPAKGRRCLAAEHRATDTHG